PRGSPAAGHRAQCRRSMITPLLAVMVLTYNEEPNLPDCLDSLTGLGCPVYVIDSGSTDRTIEIAKAAGATILTHPFEKHSQQWAWAIEQLPEAHEWILGLDADQRLTPELREELSRLLRGEAKALARYE